MLRLRTTVVLSLLALAIGVAGTHWLSQRSADEPLAMPLKRHASSRHVAVARPPRPHATARAVAYRPPLRSTDYSAVAPASTAELAPELVPLDMPPNRDEAYENLRGHLDGQLTVHIRIDGRGRVMAASVAQSSGDAVLDAHALRSVRGWRFAVPPDHPDGLSADLPMRFSSHEDPVASLR